jgi:hypothetical protein
MPVLASNKGRIWPKMPESCVDVVDATTIDLSWAIAGAAIKKAATARMKRRFSMVYLLPGLIR